MGYVIVEFPERREVFVNGVSHGSNRVDSGEYSVLRVGEGLQTFTLGGEQNCTPSEQTTEVVTNSPANPLHVVFEKRSA